MKRIIFLLTMVVFLSSNILGQTIPKQINYQGVLKDASGNVITGDFALTFKIYDDATDGTALWTEIQAVAVINGLFSVQLGSVTPITTVPFDRIHFLGIKVGTESELTPRTLLSPSPYSFMALNVLDSVITTSKIQEGAVTSSKILDGTITPQKLSFTAGTGTVTNVATGSGLTGGPVTTTGTISIATGGVTSAMIQDATITGTDIANSTISATKLNFTPGTGTVTNVATGSGLTGGPVTTTGTISIATGGVTSAMIQDATITGTDIANGAILSSDLATNSVTALKIVDGNITTAKLSDDAVTGVKILDEPGLAETKNSTVYTLISTTMTTVLTLSITIPSAGFIVLEGKSIAWLAGVVGQNQIYMQIDETEGGGIVSPYWTKAGLGSSVSTAASFFPISCQRTYSKNAGTYTFYLEAQPVIGNGAGASMNLYQTQLRATYYPTAYGIITSIKESSEGVDESIPSVK